MKFRIVTYIATEHTPIYNNARAANYVAKWFKKVTFCSHLSLGLRETANHYGTEVLSYQRTSLMLGPVVRTDYLGGLLT